MFRLAASFTRGISVFALAMVFVHATAVRAAVIDFSFGPNPTLVHDAGGNGTAVGSRYIFSNVAIVNGLSIDAEVRLDSTDGLSFTDGTYNAVDGHNQRNDLVVSVGGGQSAGTAYGEFTVSFLNSGTSTLAAPMNIRVSAYDLDGTRSNGQNFVDVFGAKDFDVANLAPGSALFHETARFPGYDTWRVLRNGSHQHEVDSGDMGHQLFHTVTLDYLNANTLKLAYGYYGGISSFNTRLGVFDFSGEYAVPPAVPEPSSLVLASLLGGVGLVGSRWRKRRVANKPVELDT